MQFLKSLFCLLGFDNRSRFFAICASVYAIFIMLVSAFTSQLVVAVFITLLFTVVLALTNLRRLHDAELNKNWLFVPSIAFITVALIIIFAEQYSSYALLIIPALCSAVLLTYPSRKSRSFILGYYGPVNMQEYQKAALCSSECEQILLSYWSKHTQTKDCGICLNALFKKPQQAVFLQQFSQAVNFQQAPANHALH